MKKNFIYLALAAMTTLCLTACNSDDEDDKVVRGELHLGALVVAGRSANATLSIAIDG